MLPRPLARGAAINLAARLASVALGLGILVMVARLGPAVQGAFALFVAIESVLLTLFSGLGLLLAREISNRRVDPAPLLAALLRASLGLGAGAAVLLLAAAAMAEAAPYRHLWLLALAAPLLLLVPTASGLWLGQGRMLPLNAPQVAAPALVLAALSVLALLRPDTGGLSSVLPVLAAWVVGKAIVGALTGLAAARSSGRVAHDVATAIGPTRGHSGGGVAPDMPTPTERAAACSTGLAAPDWSAVRGQWRFVAVIGATNVVSLLNYRATLFLVERNGGLAETGVYSVAVQVAELLWLLSSAVTVSAYHRIGVPDPAEAAATTLRAVRFNLLATWVAAPFLYWGAAFALPRVLGPAYADALLPLALLLPGVAGYAAASSLSAYYTNHRGRPQWSAAIAALSLGLTLAIAAWSVPRFGAAGAALATSLAYSIAIAVAMGLFLRDTGLGWGALFAAGVKPSEKTPRRPEFP
ncbi:MAG: teichoic acid transporter [Methylibium sp.]|uniref:lipopolysaccharide biosynthesis protein n=1 Tax=Methylibium sp. TaxID=2067992 RepID=UPI001799D0DF|nr:polysaccharide biosynthesis C-terminal domain-containing protein [Methylibium sp.]MBA3596138.1 teichoic acid transporter [Methylibium sp.]